MIDMLMPKRTKFRRPHRVSYEGKAKNSSIINGDYALLIDKASHKVNKMPDTDLKHQSAENSSSQNPEVKTSEQASEQKSLVGITRENTNSSSDGDDDLLDIPAFLRTQAN